MEVIVITIKPQHLCNIMNGIKKGEVRKNKAFIKAVKELIKKYGKAKFYVVCGNGGKILYRFKHPITNETKYITATPKEYLGANQYEKLNGKVVCSFECEKVEGIYLQAHCDDKVHIETDNLCEDELLDLVCLTREDFAKYIPNATFGDTLKGNYPCALLHISNLTPFEEPKEIKELMKPHTPFDIAKVKCIKKDRGMCNNGLSLKTGEWIGCNKFRLTKAPQNFCYVEDTL